MANKREFKKSIDAVGASAIDTMMTAYYQVDEEAQDKIAKAIEKVLGATGAAKSNADITFDKGVKEFGNLKEYSVAKKKFYKALFDKVMENFSQELNDALKDFNAAIPQSLKDLNKAAVAK